MTLPPRCDLCNKIQQKGTACWEYITPNVAPSEEESKRTGDFWCEDIRWCVCIPCHKLIVAGDEAGLRERSFECQKVSVFGNDPQISALRDAVNEGTIAEIARVHRLFWANFDRDQIKKDVV